MQQFAKNLDEMLAKDAVASAAEPTPEKAEPAAMAADPTTASTSSAEHASTNGASGPSGPSSEKRIINGPAAEPIDAFSLGGSAILKRVLPLVGGLVVLLLALRRRKQ
jgi:hypothetical protein